MKSILLSILFFLVPKLVISQVSETKELILSPDDRIVFLDSTNVETKSKDYAFIFVVKDSKLKKESYTVQEYYRSGELRMEGSSKTSDGYSYDGEMTNYYKNGIKKSLVNYVKGKINGKDFEWYENGTKKLEGENIDDEKKKTSQLKINQFWDANGVQKVVDGNGDYEERKIKFYGKGKLKNGVKDGIWKGWVDQAKIKYTEYYRNGQFMSGEIVDENNSIIEYDVLETKPKYKSGVMDFYNYVARNYRAPNVQGLKGKVYVTFVVDVDGKIVEPKVLRDLGYGTGEEALRVLKNCDNWVPAEQRGRKIRCSFSLPITINSSY